MDVFPKSIKWKRFSELVRITMESQMVSSQTLIKTTAINAVQLDQILKGSLLPELHQLKQLGEALGFNENDLISILSDDLIDWLTILKES